MSARTWVLDHFGARPLTVNRVTTMHRQQWAKHTRETRTTWALLARAEKIPALAAASFTVTPLHRDRRTPQDVAACAPEFKACLDGIVDAGVLPDDGPTYVRSVTFLSPWICGEDGIRIRITEETTP